MALSPGKRKNRRASTGSDIDVSSSRSRSSADPRRPKTTDDIDSTLPNGSSTSQRSDSTRSLDIRSDARDGNGSSTPGRDRAASLNADTANADTATLRDQDEASRDGDRSSQRRKSLSDLVATIDPATTTLDRRIARSRTTGEDARSLGMQPLDDDSLNEVLKRTDQSEGEILPALQEAALNDDDDDGDDDGDDRDDTELQPGDVDDLFQSSSYSEDQQNWRPLPPEVDSALERVINSFTTVEQTPGSPGSFLAELLPNIRADNGAGVSRELLNDAYFLAKEVIKTTVDNPLIDPEQLPDDIKQNIEAAIELVKAIDNMPGRAAFLSPEEAQIYNAQKLSSINLGTSRQPSRDRALLLTSGSSQSNISFSRTQPNPAVHAVIRDHRQSMIDRLETDLDALKDVFQSKLLKKDHHRKVLEAEAAVRKALDRIKPLLDTPSDPNTQDAEAQLIVALDTLYSLAQAYVSTERKSSIKNRIAACKGVHARIDQLRKTDDAIISQQLEKSIITTEEMRDHVLKRLGSEAARSFYKLVLEDIFSNAAPDADPQTILSSVLEALKLASRSIPSQVDLAVGAGAPLALIADLSNAVSFIQEIKDGGGVSKRQVIQGGLTTTSTVKNAALTSKAGLDIANAVKDLGSTAAQASTGLGIGIGVVGIVGGVGVTIHGGLVAYKTNNRVKSAEGIEDENIRAQVLKRIKTKRLRAIVKAVGGTIAVIGGVVAIVATGGIAVPVIAAIGAAIGVGLIGARAGRSIIKKQQGTKGTEREKLATEIFKHMNELLVAGEYNKAKELARALTNNKLKQTLMLRGADAGKVDPDTRAAALKIMRDKLKTW